MPIATTGITLLDGNASSRVKWGNKRIVIATLSFTGSYPTAGEQVTNTTWEQALGFKRIMNVIGHLGEGGPPPTTLWVAYWNPVTNKLQFFGSNGAAPAALAEKANAAYGTAPTAQVIFIGR